MFEEAESSSKWRGEEHSPSSAGGVSNLDTLNRCPPPLANAVAAAAALPPCARWLSAREISTAPGASGGVPMGHGQ